MQDLSILESKSLLPPLYWLESGAAAPAARSRSYSLRSPNRELRAAGTAAPATLPSKTLLTLKDHLALGEAGVRTARFGERSEYEGSRAPDSHSACPEETLSNAEPATGGGARTARFGEQSEYVGGRVQPLVAGSV